MKKIPSLFIAAILLFFTANTVFAKDNPKAASYKTHEVSTSSTTTITQAELKKILGKGNVTAVFSVME